MEEQIKKINIQLITLAGKKRETPRLLAKKTGIYASNITNWLYHANYYKTLPPLEKIANALGRELKLKLVSIE